MGTGGCDVSVRAPRLVARLVSRLVADGDDIRSAFDVMSRELRVVGTITVAIPK